MSKNRAPKKRSSRSMICAADNGDSASKIMKEVTINSQTKSGKRIIVIPLQRRLTAVAMTLIGRDDTAHPAQEQAQDPIIRAVAA